MDFQPIKYVLDVALEFLPGVAVLGICYSVASLGYTYYHYRKDKKRHARAIENFLAASERFQREHVDLRNTTNRVAAQHAEISIELKTFVSELLEETVKLRKENLKLRADLEALAKNGEADQK